MARILIIDDDEGVRRAATILLEANGFDVDSAADGVSGLEIVKSYKFDLVIVDLFMAGMNGLETTKAIRKYSPDMPIIAASGFMFGGACPEMPDFEAMTAEAGAISTLYKPFRPKEFLLAIQNAIGATAIAK
jgi:CheY-like chemotaxis protein